MAAQSFENTLAQPIDRAAADLPVKPEDDDVGWPAVETRTGGLTAPGRLVGR